MSATFFFEISHLQWHKLPCFQCSRQKEDAGSPGPCGVSRICCKTTAEKRNPHLECKSIISQVNVVWVSFIIGCSCIFALFLFFSLSQGTGRDWTSRVSGKAWILSGKRLEESICQSFISLSLSLSHLAAGKRFWYRPQNLARFIS